MTEPLYPPTKPFDWDRSQIVFDHVHIGVRDAAASTEFYATVLGPLGIAQVWQDERGAQFGSLVFTADREPSGPLHIAFVVGSRDEVEAFHRAGVEAGYRDGGPPGETIDGHYAAVLHDPDGNSVEAIHRGT